MWGSYFRIHQPAAFEQPPLAVIFDTDNTLYPYDPAHQAATLAAERKGCALLGVSVEEFRATFTTARNAVKQRLGHTASAHSRFLYFQRTIELLGLRTQLFNTMDLEQTYWRTFLETAQLFPQVDACIAELRAQGITTAIITDLTARIQFRKIVSFGLDQEFDYVITSEEAGFDKPHPAPFEIALEKLAVPANRVWMVGDNPSCDVRGGKACGMVTLQKVHDGVEVGEGNDQPDLIFEHFQDVVRLLARLRQPTALRA